MGLRVHNTLTNRKEDFVPVTPGRVGIYLCGPTVYKPSHIGHAVGPIIFDAIKRYLVHKGFQVTWVVNITDVEDKIIVEAAEQGCTSFELAERVAAEYLESMRALNVAGIDEMPKASEHIGNIIRFIETLIGKNAAYVSNGDVYFDVSADADYGKLSNRDISEQQGQRELQSGPKRNPGDFALWKSAKPEEPDEVKYDSPWGKGRPGWHIECSAMSRQVLGDTFDIHGGGLDLIFPHHENEIAQSETATGKPFARYWLHHGLTRFNTKKVSKSDPEMQAALAQMTLSRLLSTYSGELLRYFILSTHYRRPIEYSTEEIESKRRGLDTFYRLFERIERICGKSPYGAKPVEPAAVPDVFAGEMREYPERFGEAMDDDFNTAAAIAVLFDWANAINRFVEENKLETQKTGSLADVAFWATTRLIETAKLLGLFEQPPKVSEGESATKLATVMELHLAWRAASRAAKNFALADLIRDRINDCGIKVEDRAGGSGWRADLPADEALNKVMQVAIDVRGHCKQNKDFATADRIRDDLAAAGITLEDRADGTIWRG